MEETEFNQIKTRIKDLAAMNVVDNAARIERVAIEEALLESPYKSHLYTEQMFDHLAFLELRELNTKLDKLLAQLPQLPNTTLNFPGDVEIIEQAPGANGGTCNCSCSEIDTSQHQQSDNTIEVPLGSSPLKSETSVLHGDGGGGPGTTPRKSATRKKPVKQGVI